MRHKAFAEFFFERAEHRAFSHGEAAELLGVSSDNLHNIVKRYASKVVKREGKGIARRYDCHAVAILNWANDLFEAGMEQKSAVAFASEIYRKLLENQIRPLRESGVDAETVSAKIMSALAIVHRGAHGKAQLSLVDSNDLVDEHGRAQLKFWEVGVVTTYACGKPLLALMEHVREVGRQTRPALRDDARAEA
jgi:hypothetical protein